MYFFLISLPIALVITFIAVIIGREKETTIKEAILNVLKLNNIIYAYIFIFSCAIINLSAVFIAAFSLNNDDWRKPIDVVYPITDIEPNGTVKYINHNHETEILYRESGEGEKPVIVTVPDSVHQSIHLKSNNDKLSSDWVFYFAYRTNCTDTLFIRESLAKKVADYYINK